MSNNPGDSQVTSPQAGVITGAAAQHDVSPALRDIKPIPVEKPTTIREMPEPVENEATANQPPRPQITDPVRRSAFNPFLPNQAGLAAPAPQVNFEGVNNIDGVYPPDTNGDVGPNNYVQWVNLHFQIFDKTGKSLYGPAAGNTLWSGFGGACQTQNAGDPIVLYDQMANRWIMGQFTSSPPFGECIAVSTTGDPTGSWYRYFFQFATRVFYDYPKLGIWSDGYYLTANRFTASFLGASAIALDRSKMLTGAAATYQEKQPIGALAPAPPAPPTAPASARLHCLALARRPAALPSL